MIGQQIGVIEYLTEGSSDRCDGIGRNAEARFERLQHKVRMEMYFLS